jgi:hypothetical protein
VRIGFVTQLLWSRYGDFWLHALQGIDAEAVFAPLEAVKARFGDEHLRNIPGMMFQLATAQALALDDVDIIVVPSLNDSDAARGSGQEAWVADFPNMLTTFGNFPKILSIPAGLEDVESLAIETLLSLSRESAKVKRSWERNSHRAKPKRFPDMHWTKLPYQKEIVGVLGQPWILTSRVLSLLDSSESLMLAQSQLEPKFLIQEAPKQKRHIDTDAEVLGAAHFFNRKGAIDRLLFIADQASPADIWLEKHIRQLSSKPLEVRYLQDLVAPDNLVEKLLVQEDSR